jgi:intein/homing endonuclease
MSGWLQGFFDGEGCAVLWKKPWPNGNLRTRYCVVAANTDWSLVRTCSEYLDSLGISHKINGPYQYRKDRKPNWRILITKGANIVAFSDQVGFASPEKAGVLSELVAWIKRPGRRMGPVSWTPDAQLQIVSKEG